MNILKEKLYLKEAMKSIAGNANIANFMSIVIRTIKKNLRR